MTQLTAMECFEQRVYPKGVKSMSLTFCHMVRMEFEYDKVIDFNPNEIIDTDNLDPDRY